MQPFTRVFAEKELTLHEEEIIVKEKTYQAKITDDKGYVIERGPEEEKIFTIEHVLGGKNVYYFLTSLDRGRLQTLPLAYDVHEKTWFDTAASGLRHVADEPVDWRDAVYTFNTACYRCHVSQLSTNYDLETDTYHTTWSEPGINCETCHGPGDEHVRFCQNLPEGITPTDWKITRGGSSFTVKQNNDTCAPCHAKMSPLTPSFQPGDRFFDHYDLNTLEDPDFYPDGRDLGENYTHTSWLMSPCVKSGQLSCLHCHTSSGRYKHIDDPNLSCTPCHEQRVADVEMHSRHPADSEGSLCISCHMPLTEFARMKRSDHSMLPPTPATTLKYGSPNACNLCHFNMDAAWADQMVRELREPGYQEPVLHRAGLIDDARKHDWSRLPEMLNYLEKEDHDSIFANSLIRLLRDCDNVAMEQAYLKTLDDASPLVRSSAAEALQALPSEKVCEALIAATGDDFRIVRIKAAASLGGFAPWLAQMKLNEEAIDNIRTATLEFLDSLLSRPDHWASHYNLGNFLMDNGDMAGALASYETSLMLEPRAVLALVNAALGYSAMGDNDKAEEYLQKALDVESESPVVRFNMGLLKAEQSLQDEAELHLRAALALDPTMSGAAYNLGILLANNRPEEAIELLSKAYTLSPSPQYGYTQAFFMRQSGYEEEAITLLHDIVDRWPASLDAVMLLGDIYEKQGRLEEVRALYKHTMESEEISDEDRIRLEWILRKFELNKSNK